MASVVAVGVGIAGIATLARFGLKAWQKSGPGGVPKMPKGSPFKSYFRGGFEPKMSRREAALVLGIRETAPKDKLKEAHRKIMLLNHPDRDGSPYLATKINEAKELLEKMSR